MSGNRAAIPTPPIEGLYGILDSTVITLEAKDPEETLEIALSEALSAGITRENVREVIRAGASGCAVISDLFGGPEIRERAKEFLRVWEEEKNRR